MEILIRSRKEIERMASVSFREKTALISITDFDYHFAELKNKPDFLLQIKFDDVPVADDFGEEIGHEPTEEEKKIIEVDYHTLTDEGAKQIAEFYNSVKDKAEILICQCEYGQSRSAALAAAFIEYESRNGIRIFADDRYVPNKSVFRKIYSLLKNLTNENQADSKKL